MSLRQFLLILRARWRVAVGISGFIVIAGLLVSLLMPAQYTATASVVVDAKADPVEGVVYSAQMLTGYIATQVDIISSDRVAQHVVKDLKLDRDPETIKEWKDSTDGRGDIVDWLGMKLDKKLDVTPSRDSSVIQIAVRASDPKHAAVLANAFAQAYMDTNIELKVDPAKQYAAYFNQISRSLRADLEAKQKKLADYEAATGIIATDGRLDIENARLAELSTQLSTIQALRQDSQSRQRQSNSDIDSLPEVLQSPLVAGLKADLSRAEAKLQDIATSLGKNHPDYKDTAAEVASLRARIEQESAKIAVSLGNTTQVNLRRESEIRAALDAQKKRMLDLTHQHDQMAVLQNDVVTAQRDLDAVTQRFAQSSLESKAQQTNISLLTPAVEPLYRSSPRLLLNLAISVFLGVVFGVGAVLLGEMLDKRIREAADLTQLMNVPILGRIPPARPDGRIRRAAPSVLTRAEPSAI
jgi:succinoglycan biosynthesis transport protein ExoP